VLRWITGDSAEIERGAATNRSDTAEDHDGEYVALFSSDWRRKRAEEDFPALKFHAVREQHGVVAMRRGQ
jgi:peptide chain release factor 3